MSNDKIFRFNEVEDPNKKYKLSDKNTIFGEYASLNDINKVFPMNKSMNNITVYADWDDVFQFTSLGFIDYIYCVIEKHLEETRFDLYPVVEFFERNNNFLDGIKFAHRYFQNKVPYDKLKELYKLSYNDFILNSPMSAFIPALYGSDIIIKNLILGFNHEPNDMTMNTIKSIQKHYYKDKIELMCINKENNTFSDILDEYTPKLLIVRDGGELLSTIIDKKLEGLEIYTHLSHNGFSEKFLHALSESNVGVLSNKCKIFFYEDKVNGFE